MAALTSHGHSHNADAVIPQQPRGKGKICEDIRELAARFSISATTVKNLLRERRVRRAKH